VSTVLAVRLGDLGERPDAYPDTSPTRPRCHREGMGAAGEHDGARPEFGFSFLSGI
jgi:hypothetical protein